MTAWKDERKNKKAAARRRPVPQMPEGYYSGDKPNPNLRAFVQKHLAERPYDPETDKYDVPAFDHAIETTKATAIYNMHTYWSKKPHDAIREYIRHYTKPGDLVLDPFCGSGGTALAALMEGRKAIAIDRSPAATFITKNYCTPVDVDELQAAFEELKARVMPEIDWLYETRCDRCGGKATTAYTVYSQVFQCPRCMEKVALFDCVERKVASGERGGGKAGKNKLCPFCLQRGFEEPIRARGEDKLGAIPVLVSYICESGCTPKRGERRHNDPDPKKREIFVKYDLEKIHEIGSRPIPHWYPQDKFPRGDRYHRDGLKYNNIDTVADFFTKRNLWALAAVREAINNNTVSSLNSILCFAFTSILLGMSKMYRWSEEGQHDIVKGTYYIPQLSREINVLQSYEAKFGGRAGITAVPTNINNDLIISTESATSLSEIPVASCDYIFTDPPYAGNVQYGELNFIWESWLKFDTVAIWHNDEIIINEVRGKTQEDWFNAMRKAMFECHSVLKPGRAISLCYHDTSEGTWSLIQDLMAEVGFVVEKTDSALYIDSAKKTFNQETADKVNKRDLVINFRKPKPGELGVPLIMELDDFGTFQDKVKNIITIYLTSNPGSTKDRIYDEVVSRMVRRGRMESHNFENLLSQVAEPVHPEGGANGAARWYLRETEIDDSAESGKEDAAADIIKGFIDKAKKPEDQGVHYSDIFEHYVYSVPAKDKPRRPLVEWLLDYFYKTDEGTYRLPASPEEEQIKKEGRSQGVSRRIKRYLAYLEQGVPVPAGERPGDATIADWIRHCKRSGMYEQGKLLYEKGGLNLESLTEESQVNADEDYQICGKMLARTGGAEKRAKRSRKAGTAEEI